MSFRKEKKYRLTTFDYHMLQNLLFKKGMQRLYEKRVVNSIYYDTSSLDMFHQSEEGELPRKKIRIRWYNNDKKFSLEKKTSSIEGRYKSNCSLNCNAKDKLPFTLLDDNYGKLTQSLYVFYERLYFTIEKVRITFDLNIGYKNLRQNLNNIFEDPERVMEVKTSIFTSEDFIESIIPIQITRFSKYSRGIHLTSGN